MRKILIVPSGTIEQYKNLADENNIAEIVEGIPPSLTDQYTDNNLPIIHEELPPPPPEPTETELLAEYLLDVDFRVAMLELGLI